MGVKGDKATSKGVEFVETLVPRLAPLGEVTTKSMFGGYGIFQTGKMFALVTSSGELFLKADETNQARFAKAKSAQHGKMPYFQVPATVLTSDKKLIEWANSSIEVAHG